VNPNSKTTPVFRARADAELTAKIYAHIPVLIDEAKDATGNPWGVSFMRMFDMANDSGLFRTATQLLTEGYERTGSDWHALDRRLRYVPLYEAKMISQYDHRFGSYGARGDDRGFRVLPNANLEEYKNYYYEPVPFYYISEPEIKQRIPPTWKHDWLLAFKDVTAVTNERTAIFSAIPVVGVGHSAPLIFPSRSAGLSASLLANLNSLIVDYCTRTKIGGVHLTYTYLQQLPILPPGAYSERDLAFIVPHVLELTYTSHAMAPFALDLGFDGPPFAWDEARRANLRADLDAFYARAYGLTRDELRYILDPADVRGPGYPSETFRVLKKNDIARYGEYRTARLVLAAWDAQEAASLRKIA
jgi:hypothetical protein